MFLALSWCDLDAANVIATIAAGISLLIAFLAWRNAKAAKAAIRQAARQQYFSTFNVASQAMITNPEFLYSVHGLDKSVPIEDAPNIAYLGLLMDSFQNYYDWQFESNFAEMEKELTERPAFLNRVVSVQKNQERWAAMKDLFYNDYDAGFVDAVDHLIDNLAKKEEQAKKDADSD